MALSNSAKVSEKAKLQRELEFYTNLVSNHEKLLQTGKRCDVKTDLKQSVVIKPFKNYIQLGNCSRNPRSVNTINEFPHNSVGSNVSISKRSVMLNKYRSSLFTPSVFSQRTVIKSSPNNQKNLTTAATYKKINNNPQRTVLHSTKSFVAKAPFSTRSVLPAQVTLKNPKQAVSQSCITKSAKSNDLQKALSETKKIFMKIDSKKRIDELNALTKQLEKRNKNVSVTKKNISVSRFFLKSCDIAGKANLKSINSRSPSNSVKPLSNCSILKNKNLLSRKSLLSSHQMGEENMAKLINSAKCLKSDCVLKPVTQEINLKDLCNIKKTLVSLPARNIETSISCSVNKGGKLTGNTFLPSSKQTPEIRKENASKELGNIKKSLSSLGTTCIKASLATSAVKVKRSKSFISSRENSDINSGPVNNHLKSVKRSPITLTPVSKKMKLQKYSSINKRANMTKLVASKYKIVNKKLPDSLMLSSQKKFLMHKVAVSPIYSQNKYSQNTYKGPSVIKTLNTNYKVVNLVKAARRFSNSPLKTSTPTNLMKNKYAFLKRSTQKYQTTPSQSVCFQRSFAQKPVLPKHKLIFKHNKVNSLVRVNSEKSLKLNLNKKSYSPAAISKYRIVNKPGSSKKLSKSLKLKHDVVRRTKSGVDIDLLLELAAEKESTENESIVKTLTKKSVLLKRVYKSKNAIVNKNVCSSAGNKVAKMIKAKYSLNKRNSWNKQAISGKFVGFKHYKGHPFSSSFQKTPTKPFYNHRIKRSYFKPPVQKRKHVTKILKTHRGSLQYGKTYQRNFFRNNHLKTFQNQVNSTPLSKILASRVLNRSINRVLTASVKKKLSKVNTYCMFYNRFGRCNKGIKCNYIHDPSKIAVCTRFLRGTCKNENCLFSHEISPGKMAICSFFLLGSCTKTDCPYRHEILSPDAELCKAFVQGYCPNGKQCKKAHVLVCPQYIQGFCEKGDACAFPHPPSKEKKILQKPLEEIETPVETEDFMDRVSRYFQPSNEQTAKVNETAVVPRRQKLPEQPSFIAL